MNFWDMPMAGEGEFGRMTYRQLVVAINAEMGRLHADQRFVYTEGADPRPLCWRGLAGNTWR
jgi:hypothetical protein